MQQQHPQNPKQTIKEIIKFTKNFDQQDKIIKDNIQIIAQLDQIDRRRGDTHISKQKYKHSNWYKEILSADDAKKMIINTLKNIEAKCLEFKDYQEEKIEQTLPLFGKLIYMIYKLCILMNEEIEQLYQKGRNLYIQGFLCLIIEIYRDQENQELIQPQNQFIQHQPIQQIQNIHQLTNEIQYWEQTLQQILENQIQNTYQNQYIFEEDLLINTDFDLEEEKQEVDYQIQQNNTDYDQEKPLIELQLNPDMDIEENKQDYYQKNLFQQNEEELELKPWDFDHPEFNNQDIYQQQQQQTE